MKTIYVAAAAILLASTAANANGPKQKTGIEVKGPTYYEQCVEARCKNAHFKSNEAAATRRQQEHFWKHQLQLGSVGAVGGGGGSE
jgi:hypothetical protein